MRILHIGKYYPPAIGGIERIVQLMARSLVRHEGCEVDVLVANDGPHATRADDMGVSLRRLARFGAFKGTPLTPAMVRAVAAAGRYDVVHIHSPNPIPEMSWLALHPNSRLVANDWGQITHYSMMYKLYRPFFDKYYGTSTAVAVPSKRYGETAPHLRPFAGKTFVIPPGIDPADWRATEASATAAVAMGAGADGFTVLFVGRLVRWKGVDVLLRAARESGARVLIAGEGPERAALEALAAELGMGQRAKFLGPLTGPPLVAAYRAADAFVLPSISPNESFGLVLLEAMACGLPLVTTELGTGTTEINRDGESGFAVAPNDPAALAGAISRLKEDEALSRRMGEAALERVKAEYSETKMAQRLIQCYRWCLDGAHGG